LRFGQARAVARKSPADHLDHQPGVFQAYGEQLAHVFQDAQDKWDAQHGIDHGHTATGCGGGVQVAVTLNVMFQTKFWLCVFQLNLLSK